MLTAMAIQAIRPCLGLVDSVQVSDHFASPVSEPPQNPAEQRLAAFKERPSLMESNAGAMDSVQLHHCGAPPMWRSATAT